MKKKIAIIGSGIAGLTLGNLLKKNSIFDFSIYEREDGLSLEEGFGIQLSTNSISILKEIDFDHIKESKLYHPKKINFFSIDKKKICELDLTKFNTGENKYTTLRRSVLVEFLQEKIYKNLKFKKEIKKISELKDKILINFNDNTNDLVDYLFVCDGVFSNTKSLIEKKPKKPKFSKSIAIRSIIETSKVPEIDSQNISLYLGSNAHIVTYPINNKGDLNVVCVLRTIQKDEKDPKKLIDNLLLKQSNKLKNIFYNNLTAWPIYVNDKLSKPPNNKIFYLGDAFHTLMPTMAQGAAQSIEDAYEIFQLLSKNIQDIDKMYYEKRVKKIKLVQFRSKINYFSFHLSNSLIIKMRNFILKKLVKSEKFLNLYLGKIYN